MSTRAFRSAPTDANTFYPRLMGTHGVVAANSYLSVNAGVDMLKAGGVKRHKDLLAPFGLDASDPAFWNRGLDVISGFIDELEAGG